MNHERGIEMNKKVGMKLIVLLGVIGTICLLPAEIVTAEEAISTKGVIRLYTDDTTSPSSSTTEPSSTTAPSTTGTNPTKPLGRTGLPSTGELVHYGLLAVGLLVALLALFLLFYRRKHKKEEEEQ